MATSLQLPAELQKLLDGGTLRAVDANEFVIDALRHRVRTWMGWNIVIYALRIEEDDEQGVLYSIVEETESLGEDIIICSSDPDEAASWIDESISERDQS